LIGFGSLLHIDSPPSTTHCGSWSISLPYTPHPNPLHPNPPLPNPSLPNPNPSTPPHPPTHPPPTSTLNQVVSHRHSSASHRLSYGNWRRLGCRGTVGGELRECGHDARARFLKNRVRGSAAADRRALSCLVPHESVDGPVLSRAISNQDGAFECGRRVYDSIQHRKWRRRVHQAREREWHRLAQQLAWGYTSVKGKWSRGSPRTAPHHSARPAMVVIGWGNGSTGHNSVISRPGRGPSKAFVRFLRENYSHFNVHTLVVDEYCTSKVCTCCWSTKYKTPFSFLGPEGQRIPSYKLQVCQNPKCNIVVDRDVSAAIAIMARLLHMVVPLAPQGQLAGFARRHG